MLLLAALTLMPSPNAALWPRIFEHSRAEVQAVLGEGKSLGSKNQAYEYHVPGFRLFRVMFHKSRANYFIVALAKPGATCKETFKAMGIPLDIVRSSSGAGTLGGAYRERVFLQVKGYPKTHFGFTERALGRDALMEERSLKITTAW